MLTTMFEALLASAVTCGLDCGRAAQASARCADVKGVHYIEAENVLCIDGLIDVEGKLRAAVLEGTYRDRLLVVVRSEGGSLPGAIDMVEHLARFHYSIVVDGICASSCAQFLFMGADRKIIRGDGIVAMHGGPFTDPQIAAMPAENRDAIRKQRDRFLRFYADRGIGIGITNDFPANLLARLAQGRIVFWIPKEQDYARFHVRGISYCDARYRDPDNVRPAAPSPPPPGAATQG
jgi:hypothetical protein